MPRGAYDCTGAASGSYASRQARQMYPCGGGSTPRASQAALFTGTLQATAPPPPPPSHIYGAPAAPSHQAPNNNRGVMSYGFPGTGVPAQAGFVPQQQQQQQHVGAYMARPGCFAPPPPQQQQQQQMQMVGQRYAYAAQATVQLQAHPGVVYSAPRAGGYSHLQQRQGFNAYGATGFAPAVPSWYQCP
ncbi:hypothetical protein MY11210_003388 [Beauveria gryllotalpidicola]